MNSSYYKYCTVPQCKSTTIKTPDKLFIYVPNKQHIREKWLTLASRSDAHCLSISSNSRMYFCEDHFDLANDMENYMEYKIMGSVRQVRMKPGCTPSRFECQAERKDHDNNECYPTEILTSFKQGTVHHFPLPTTLPYLEKFNQWKMVLSEKDKQKGNKYICNNIRICDHHFEDFYKTASGRLTKNAVPTLHFEKYVADNRTKPNQKTVDQVGATCDSNNEIAIKASSSTNQAGTSVTYPTNEEQREITIEYNPVVDDSLDAKDFDSYDEITIEEVPPDPPKEFSWQDPEATVDLAQDEDGRVPVEYNEENLSLYCSYDNEDRKPYMSNEGAEGHAGFQCDSCAVEITGYRYTCVQCNNYDLCASCEASGVHDQHYVLRVPGPRPAAEVQRVLARIRSHLSADLNPISNEDDNVTIKSEIKEENEEPFCEEASEAVWQNVEEVHKEKGYTSREVARERQDEAEMSQEEDVHDEADPLRTDDGQSDTDTVVDSDEEWVPSNKDHGAESSDHGINKNIITSDIPIRPPPATRTIPKILRTKEMLSAKAKKTPRLVTPGVVLDGSTLKKLMTGLGSNVDDSRLRKRTIILKKSDYEKLLKSQPSAKRVRVSRETAAGPSRRAVPASTGVPLVPTRVFTIKPTATDKDTNR